MLDRLPENQDIYSARCLAHHFYGKPYEQLTHADVLRAVEELKTSGTPFHKMCAVWWPGGGEVIATLYIVRNLDKYRGDRHAVINHLYDVPPPPKAWMARRRKERARVENLLRAP